MTLTEFLLARIAEDEVVLTTTETFPHSRHGYDAPGTYSVDCPSCRRSILGGKAVARVLAECDAKRRIVENAAGPGEGDYYRGMDQMHEEVLRLLALPYADHPDYTEATR